MVCILKLSISHGKLHLKLLDKGAHIRIDLSRRLEDWLTSPRAAALINGYRLNEQTLFTFNAQP